MELTTILLGGLFVVIALLVRHLLQNRGLLETLGIPIDSTFLYFFGSPPYVFHKLYPNDFYEGKFKKFGKTFGRYEGITPVIVTIDPEIIKSVLVKNFDSFTDPFNIELSDKHTTLDVSRGETWRALRKSLSPTFTSGKLKGMLDPMDYVVDDMMAFLEEQVKKNSVVDLKPIFQGLAANMICRCAFGVEVDAYRNPDHEFVKNGKEIFADFGPKNYFHDLVFNLLLYFPDLVKYLPILPKSFDTLRDMTWDIIRTREKSGIKGNDFVARLMDLLESKKNGDFADVLTDDMIAAQGIIFFAAGFETTANTLSTTCYHLAKNPEIQEKLFQEIQDVMSSHDGKIDNETIKDMEYLDAVLAEDLRLLGPVTLHARLCTKDCEIVPGFHVKKGMRVDMPLYSSHLNEEFFPAPKEFRPERFLKENQDEIIPYTYRPFGGGPRVCIGQRFAQTEMKIAAAKLLSKYEVVDVPETKLDFNPGELFLISYPCMKVKLVERK